jgi:hypothetical protein
MVARASPKPARHSLERTSTSERSASTRGHGTSLRASSGFLALVTLAAILLACPVIDAHPYLYVYLTEFCTDHPEYRYRNHGDPIQDP